MFLTSVWFTRSFHVTLSRGHRCACTAIHHKPTLLNHRVLYFQRDIYQFIFAAVPAIPATSSGQRNTHMAAGVAESEAAQDPTVCQNNHVTKVSTIRCDCNWLSPHLLLPSQHHHQRGATAACSGLRWLPKTHNAQQQQEPTPPYYQSSFLAEVRMNRADGPCENNNEILPSAASWGDCMTQRGGA